MPENPEPLAAILADYRADIPAMTRCELPHPTPEYLRILLDRIDAAAERERAKYERLHECFWNGGAIQNIVRQMLDECDDLRDKNPKASESIGHFAQLLTKAATPAPGNAAALAFRVAGQEQAANAAGATAGRLRQLCEQREAENG